MSNIIFPEGFTIDLPDLNIEMMQYYSKQWNLEHTKMEKGLFEGNISAVHTPRIQLASAYYSQSFMSKGDFPDGCIVLIYAPNDARYNFQNRAIRSNEVIVLSKGDEIDILTYGKAEVRSIVIEEQLFDDAFYDYFGDTSHTTIKDKRFSINPEMISVFHERVNAWSTYLTSEFPTLTVKPHYGEIESEILRQLFSCMISDPLVKTRQKFQTKTIRDLLHENINQSIGISEMATKLDISEGQLHYAFRKEYGLTPKKYLQNLRLNTVRKELLLAHSHTATVKDIAKKYHFYHMGHFSTAYQKLFGQTPSETLHTKL